MRKIPSGIVIFAILLILTATQEQLIAQVNSSFDYNHWASVLERFVDDNGLVDYKALKAQPDGLNDFIGQIEQADLSGMSETGQKAFWINAYNAITLKVVTDKYPIGQIRFINFGLVWEISRSVARGEKSLGEIEHKTLRPLGDARIHFAINCASMGCPKLSREPFLPQTLDEQLDAQAVRFINDPEKVRLERQAKVLYYSSIFKWFEKDFLKAAPSVKAYIMKYINEEDRLFLEQNEVKMKVLKYDWGLNEQP